MVNNLIYHDNSSERQKTKFDNLLCRANLSEEQKAIVLEYYKLSSQDQLSHEDIYRLSTIWQMAESDLNLTQALSFIDAFHASETDGKSLANDQDIRAFLSEHVSVIAKERFDKLTGNRKELNQHSHLTLLCPDGSGFVSVNFEPGEPMSLGRLLDKVCDCHKAKLSEHQELIVAGDQFMILTGNNDMPTQ